MLQKSVQLVYNFLLKWHLTIAISVGIIAVILILVVRIKLSVSFLPDYSGSERSTIMGIQYIIQNKPLYEDPEKAPYYIVQYTPLYFYLVGTIYKLLAWDPYNVHKIYTASRFVSLAIVLLVVTLVYYLFYKILHLDKAISVLFAMLFFCITSYWNIYFSRVDSLLLLGTCLYLILVIKGGGLPLQQGRYYLIGAAALASMLFFVKQSALIHMIILLFYTLQIQSYRLFGQLAVVAGLVFGVIWLFIAQDTSSLFFSRNVFGGIQNGLDFYWFYFWTFDKLVFPFALFITFAFTIGIQWFAFAKENLLRFLSIALFGFFFFSAFTSLKQGAAVGYFIEFILVSHIALAIYFFNNKGRYLSKEKSRASKIWFSGLTICAFLHFSSFQYMTYSLTPLSMYSEQYYKEKELSSYLDMKLKPGEYIYVQGGDNFRGWFISHFLLGKTLAPMSDLVAIGHTRRTFDFSSFNTLLKEGNVKYIVTTQGSKVEPFLGKDNILEGYELRDSFYGFDIYEFSM